MVDHMRGVGLDQYAVTWKELSYDGVVAKIDEVWRSRDVIKQHMKSKSEESIRVAWSNAEIVGQFLDVCLPAATD